MLAEFFGELVECEEEILLPWGPRVLIRQEPADPGECEAARTELLAVCAQIQQEREQ